MRSTGYDAFQGEIFRKDYNVIIATKRELAVLAPVRLAPGQGDYKAGQVLAKITSGPFAGLFGKYDTAGASGLNAAACVLLENTFGAAPTDAASGVATPAIFKGILFKDKLLGYDAGAKTALNAREWSDARNVNLMEF